MTIEESIKILEQKKEYSERIIDNFLSHSRGEIKDANETIEMCDMAISALKEIQQYREIGTVEECQEAREKEIPKIPKFMRMIGEYNAMFRCFCGYGFSYDCTDTEPFFCKKCGQALRMESEE